VIGALKRRVTLQRPDRAEDAGGGAAVIWTDVATAWARVTTAAAGEGEAADALTARVAYTVGLRWREDVRPGWRVVFRGKALRVRAAVDRDLDGRFIVLQCEEEVR
jgi:SPP1 family predicted phage head-tail adaptor